ncbi:helix-turn-helix transcriptional regulator [Luteolibacter pohnpeiensis]|uniref:Helix-turn-helix transcriptional regulator n=1 Tax=Luteolibacter pohnpeiensis TaxID=454153 RepID=A0A934S5C8_9BACT|nr:helix-turn-helix transcriptional regulator [Luteolibacter pohnpeiensis]MBK1881056.1 helix-turn-helix transcriptional regulator [Luteolibacter pohnpeiensis]
MKRRDVEIALKDGLLLATLAREPAPIPLSKVARESGFQLSLVCARIGISERHFRRLFDSGVGINPKEWLRNERMVAARALLREGGPVKEVAHTLGFATPRMMSREFQLFHGVTPTSFQRREHSYAQEARMAAAQ